MTGKEKRAGIIGGLILVGLGVAAIINPDLMEGAEVSGRNFLIKLVVVYLWSRPGGVIAVLLGCASIWGVIKRARVEKENTTAEEMHATEPGPASDAEAEGPGTEEDDRKYAPPGYFDQERGE